MQTGYVPREEYSLLPALWDSVVDSLIRRLNDLDYHRIGYTDDLVILLTGKYAGTLCEIMQAAILTVEEWCSRHTVSVNGGCIELASELEEARGL